MVKFCPVSDRIVNERVSRANAFFTFIFAVIYISTGSFLVLTVMVFDFSLRLYKEGSQNPIIQFNKFLLRTLSIPEKGINAGPKIFASRIGLSLAVFAMIFNLLEYQITSQAVVGILAFFAFLESGFGFCIACKIYPYALFINDFGQKREK